MRWSNCLARLSLFAGVLLVPFATQAATEEDPWESINRPIYKFNDVLDTYALKPLAQGYQYVTPQFLEDGIHNIFRNLGDVTNLVNNVLQLKPHAAGVDTAQRWRPPHRQCVGPGAIVRLGRCAGGRRIGAGTRHAQWADQRRAHPQCAGPTERPTAPTTGGDPSHAQSGARGRHHPLRLTAPSSLPHAVPGVTPR